MTGQLAALRDEHPDLSDTQLTEVVWTQERKPDEPDEHEIPIAEGN
jgi:hypothetical protein